jgi:hypothetical protein
MPKSTITWSRSILILAAVMLLVGGVLQLIRPEFVNPPVTAELQAPPEVKAVLRNSCYDCHSNETALRWFDRIVPPYWLVVQDVKRARQRLNFSTIGAEPPAMQRAELLEAVNQIQMGAMPLPSYIRLHPQAAVTADQLAVLRGYLNPAHTAAPSAAGPDTVAMADTQYQQWISGRIQPLHVAPAPNGIEFLPDYKNWRAISSTDRFDNSSLRLILGNDVAINAIRENHINPWPDGTTFAKVAWLQQPDGSGVVKTGAFQQVEFMIKDSRKYASTAGWGWARWRGGDLKPYGAGADFTNECVGCHMPLRENDYVFTAPIARER